LGDFELEELYESSEIYPEKDFNERLNQWFVKTNLMELIIQKILSKRDIGVPPRFVWLILSSCDVQFDTCKKGVSLRKLLHDSIFRMIAAIDPNNP